MHNTEYTDFDTLINRRGSGSYKWDSDTNPDVIPLWVADMDFRTAPAVIDALRRRVDHGVFGYTLVGDDYYDALVGWFAKHHNYHIDRDMVIYTSGVVPAISAIIKAMVRTGDGVIVQTPVYNCFFSSIRNNDCRIVEAPLHRINLSHNEFTYEMDFAALEQAAADPSNTMFLLCNPHNPAGRAWRSDELSRVAEICARHNVVVVSDEIHCELTRPGMQYTPYSNVDRDTNGSPRAIICLSPSKAFNTAGLQIANIVCPNEKIRTKIDRAININEVCDVNPFGVEGLKAAYSEQGAQWLESLRKYIFDNYDYTVDFVHQQLPDCPIGCMEATYLPWIDVSHYGIPAEEIEERMKHEAKVWVNCGEMYGVGGYIRLNIACPRAILTKGLNRMASWLKAL